MSSMISIVVFDKCGDVLDKNVKKFEMDCVYKKCGFKSMPDSFGILLSKTYNINEIPHKLEIYGKTTGKLGQENLCDNTLFPICDISPHKNIYGNCIGVLFNYTDEKWNQLPLTKDILLENTNTRTAPPTFDDSVSKSAITLQHDQPTTNVHTEQISYIQQMLSNMNYHNSLVDDSTIEQIINIAFEKKNINYDSDVEIDEQVIADSTYVDIDVDETIDDLSIFDKSAELNQKITTIRAVAELFDIPDNIVDIYMKTLNADEDVIDMYDVESELSVEEYVELCLF